MNTVIDVIMVTLLYGIGLYGTLKLLIKLRAPERLNIHDMVSAIIWPIIFIAIMLAVCTSCLWPRWREEPDYDDMGDEYDND